MHNFELPFSTFGGNAYSSAAGLETLRVLEEQELAADSGTRGTVVAGLRNRLDGHPLVRAIRGRGLLVGIEFGPTDKGVLNRLCPRLVEMVIGHLAYGFRVSSSNEASFAPRLRIAGTLSASNLP